MKATLAGYFANFDDYDFEEVVIVAPFILLHLVMEITDPACPQQWQAFRFGMN